VIAVSDVLVEFALDAVVAFALGVVVGFLLSSRYRLTRRE
jgi:hypothetical protein